MTTAGEARASRVAHGRACQIARARCGVAAVDDGWPPAGAAMARPLPGPSGQCRAAGAGLGVGRNRSGPAGALARGRIRRRHRRVLCGRARARALGGARRCSSAPSPSPSRCGRRPIAFPAALGLAAMAAGLGSRDRQDARSIAHPVLSAPVWNADVAGFVELREERERSDRIVVRVTRIAGPRLNETLERVRVSVRKGTAPAVGSFVEFKARLSPPLSPLRPGGYDFARDMYFQGIGASGFVLGPHSPGRSRQGADVLSALCRRHRRHARGDRQPHSRGRAGRRRRDRFGIDHRQARCIVQPVFDAMYASGIGHVLSISGYHMALVAGIIFFVLRASFALMRAFTGRHSDQEMGGRRGVMRGCVLSAAVGRRGRHPAVVHHDRDRAGRRHGGSPDAHGADADGGGAGRAADRARGDRPSELPDVVRRHARAGRRLSARVAVDEPQRRHAAWRRVSRCGEGARSSG